MYFSFNLISSKSLLYFSLFTSKSFSIPSLNACNSLSLINLCAANRSAAYCFAFTACCFAFSLACLLFSAASFLSSSISFIFIIFISEIDFLIISFCSSKLSFNFCNSSALNSSVNLFSSILAFIASCLAIAVSFKFLCFCISNFSVSFPCICAILISSSKANCIFLLAFSYASAFFSAAAVCLFAEFSAAIFVNSNQSVKTPNASTTASIIPFMYSNAFPIAFNIGFNKPNLFISKTITPTIATIAAVIKKIGFANNETPKLIKDFAKVPTFFISPLIACPETFPNVEKVSCKPFICFVTSSGVIDVIFF